MLMSPAQTFRNPKPDLQNLLRESGPVGDANGAGATSKAAPKKKSRNVDMEKLADALPHLQEDDLLQIVQMVHDNKSEDTYTKNDLESKFTLCPATMDGRRRRKGRPCC